MGYNKYVIASVNFPISLYILSDRASGGRESYMSEIKVRENESLESALRRFKKQCSKSGVMKEARKREHYEKPSVRKKMKSEAARKRNKRNY